MRRFVALGLLGLGAAGLHAQTPQLLRDSNTRARATLARALDAHGGLERLRAVRSIWLEESGQVWLRTQGPSPGRPLRPRPVRNVLMVDFARQRGCDAPDLFTHSDTTRLEEMYYAWHPRTIVKDGTVTSLHMWMHSRAEPRAGGLQELRPQQRRLATSWLLEAHGAVRTLRALGDETLGGQATNLIGFATADGRTVALRIGADGLLQSVESLGVDPTEGDYQSVVRFSDYRRVAGLMQAGRRTEDQDADRVFDMRVTRLGIDEGVDESCFAVPDTFITTTQAPRPRTETVKLADGVYLLQALGGSYNALAVVFDTFVTVIEAPEATPPQQMSEQAIAMVRAVAGDKPIRYLGFTHFHTDHGGGVRDYIAEGATILVPRGTRAWLDDVMRAKFEMAPDRLARAPQPLKAQVIDDRHVIEEGTQRLEFHMAGWDHATEEMLVYLPNARLIFEGDLFASGEGDAPVAQLSASLITRTIRERTLAVDRVVGVHGKVRPIAEVDRALRRRRERIAMGSQ